jgi:hypothetical protein
MRDVNMQDPDDIKCKLIENGDFERLRQRFLAELLLSHSESTTSNSTPSIIHGDESSNDNEHYNWVEGLIEGLRRKEGNAVDLTLEDLSSTISTLGKASVPPEVQSKMMAMIEAAIKQHLKHGCQSW